jgi:Tfp pilus assembly protein PilF
VNNLALLLESKGEYAVAEALYRRALEASERVLGPEHPNTLSSVNNLAGLMESKGEYAEAEALYRRALEARERVLGLEHPDTLTSVNDLAGLLASKGDCAAAETEYLKAVDRSPSNAMVLGNYAFFLQNARRDSAGARDLFLRALLADPTDSINHTKFAGLCIVTYALQEAEEHLREAWRLMAGKADRYTSRTLFLRAALAALRNEDAALYLGQLKTLFDQGVRPSPTRNTSVLEHLQQNLSANQVVLFAAIYDAIDTPGGLLRLSVLPTWQALQPRPIDEPWP